jgi:hypothetical protein
MVLDVQAKAWTYLRSKSYCRSNRRSFDCGTRDSAVSAFAQDDNSKEFQAED